MDAAVVKLNSLSDPVGAAAQDHDLGLVRADRILIRGIVGGIVVGAVFGAADMDALPGFFYTQLYTAEADAFLGNLQKLTQVFVRKAVLLGLGERLIRGKGAFAGHKGFFLLHQFFHLLDKPCLDLGDLVDLLHGGSLAEGFIHDKMTFAGRGDQQL